MQTEVVCQGRRLDGCQMAWLRQWIALHPEWSRKRLSRELCQQWDWRNGRGQLKDFAARSLLEKLEARGLLVLPALQLLRRHPRPKATSLVEVKLADGTSGGFLEAIAAFDLAAASRAQYGSKAFSSLPGALSLLGIARGRGKSQLLGPRSTRAGFGLSAVRCGGVACGGPR